MEAPTETTLDVQERRRILLGRVQERGFCTIAELSVALGVSEMTIRRDTRLLVQEGRLRSVHGGVTRPVGTSLDGVDDAERAARVAAARSAIATRCVQLLPEQGAIALDSGPLVAALARRLPASARLQIVTPSLPVLTALADSDFDVIGLGGTLQAASASFAGPATLAAIGELRVRTFVLSADGITSDGVYCGSHLDAMTKRALIGIADAVILVAESGMFDRSAMVRACSLTEVNVLVTDDGLSADDRDTLTSHGVTVITAMPSTDGVN